MVAEDRTEFETVCGRPDAVRRTVFVRVMIPLGPPQTAVLYEPSPMVPVDQLIVDGDITVPCVLTLSQVMAAMAAEAAAATV